MNNAEPTDLDELVEYLARTTRLERGQAERLVDEVLSFLGEQPEQFVRRRHLELQRQGLSNEADLRTARAGAFAPTFCCAGLLQAATAPHRLRLGTLHVRNRRLYRQASGGAHPARRPASARISRLRLGRHRGRQQGQAAGRQAQGPGARARRPAAAEIHGHARHRPYPLGDPWRAERPQRPSPQRRAPAATPSCTTASSRMPRRCAAQLAERGCRLHLRHRHRGARPSHRPDRRRLAARDRRAPRRCAASSAPMAWRSIDAERPDTLVVARNGSPIVLGIGDKRDVLRLRSCGAGAPHRAASSISTTARSPRSAPTATRRAPSRARATTKTPSTIPWKDEAFDKGEFTHYMRKEIGEQPEAVRRTLQRPAGHALPDDPSRRDRARRARPARHPAGEDPGLRRGLSRRPASART